MRAMTISLALTILAATSSIGNATPPGRMRTFEGCVIDGLLLERDGHEVLLLAAGVDHWTTFNGKVIRFTRMQGHPTPSPTVIGTCDPKILPLGRARALATRAIHDFLNGPNYGASAAAVSRAAKMASDDCEILADHVFVLEQRGQHNEAKERADRAAALQCPPKVYERQLGQLRIGELPQRWAW